MTKQTLSLETVTYKLVIIQLTRNAICTLINEFSLMMSKISIFINMYGYFQMSMHFFDILKYRYNIRKLEKKEKEKLCWLWGFL